MSGSSPLDGTNWVLIGPSNAVAAATPAVEVTIGFTGDRVSGTSGCNRFHGSYLLDDGGCTIGPLAVTMMACEPAAMEVERDVLARLARTAALALADDLATLTLLDTEGAELLTYAAQGAGEMLGRWLVTSIHHPAREAITSVTGDRELAVEFADGSIAGDAGCNRFRGTCTIDGNDLVCGPLMTTRKWCGDEVMEQEHALLAALADTVGFRLEGSRLTLLRPDGGIAVSLRRPDA